MPQFEVFILIGLGIAIVAYLRWYFKAPDPGPPHLEIYRAGYKCYTAPDGCEWLKYVHQSNATPELRKAIAVGSVLSEQNGFVINRIETGVSAQHSQHWLADYWNITDEHSARREIHHLFDAGHRVILDRVAQLGQTLDPNGIVDTLVHEFAGYPASDLREFADNFAGTGPALVELGRLGAAEDLPAFGTSGYDLGRVVTVSRVCAAAGILSVSEAEGYCMQALQVAEHTFPTWASFATSYLAGRALWGGVSDSSFPNMHQTVDMLLEQSQSPWVELPLR